MVATIAANLARAGQAVITWRGVYRAMTPVVRGGSNGSVGWTPTTMCSRTRCPALLAGALAQVLDAM